MQSKLLRLAEQNRMVVLANVEPAVQETLGQYFTPVRAAELIASMPRLPQSGAIRVLDPGAGSGMLSAALASRVLDEAPELDEMRKYLHKIAWETDVWCAEDPTHLIHFNGERFLGPYR